MAQSEGRGSFLYTASTDGSTYRVLIPNWLGSDLGTQFGFGADDTSRPSLPRYIKMRYVTAKSTTTARHRKIHAGTVTCAGWTVLGATLVLYMIGGATEVFQVVGQVGEKRRGSVS